ncbi:hypothetical protein ACQ4PT_039746 [Festuca glaucescens]
MAALVKMLAANLFRALPQPTSACPLAEAGANARNELPAASLLPSWPHLGAVYDGPLAAVAVDDAKSLRAHVDHPFRTAFLALFASEEPREQDRLNSQGHLPRALLRARPRARLHAPLHGQRPPPVRQQGLIAVLLLVRGRRRRRRRRRRGVGDLRQHHQRLRGFLMRVLLPLRRTRWRHSYHRQLVYCVLQFVHKDPGLACTVLQGVLLRWPFTNCQKEVLLIDELEDIVEALEQHQFPLALPIYNRIVLLSEIQLRSSQVLLQLPALFVCLCFVV